MNPLFLFRKEMTPIRKLLLMHIAAGGKLIEQTATGNPLTFVTDVVKPFLAFELSMLPVQAGSGDPYPPGGGKNMYDVDTYPFTTNRYINGSTDGTWDYGESYKATLDFIPCSSIAGQTVTLNKRPGGNNPGIAFYSSASEESYISGIKNDYATEDTPWTFEIPSTANYMRFTVRATSTDIQIEKGSSATSYSPYSNVRPISGTSGVTAWHGGKNMFDSNVFANATGITLDANGYYSGTVRSWNAAFSSLLPMNAKITESDRATISFHYYFSEVGSYTGTALQLKLHYIDGGTGIVLNFSPTVTEDTAFSGATPNNHDTDYMTMNITDARTNDYVLHIKDFQIEYGTTASDYTPYSGNSYPVVFPALGKNLFDKDTVESGKSWWKGAKQSLTTINASAMIPVIPGETYTLARTHQREGQGQGQVEYFNQNGEYISQDLEHWLANPSTNAIPDGVYYIAFNVNDDGLSTAMFVKGNSTGSYEPYTNTIYGGTLDLTTGVLTATWKRLVINDVSWILANAGYFYTNVDDHKRPPSSGGLGLLCSAIPYGGTKASNLFVDGYMYDNSYGNSIYVKDTSCANESALKSKYGEYDIVYPLAEPITYQLTPQQVQTLVGTNTVWSNANGDCGVTYLKRG